MKVITTVLFLTLVYSLWQTYKYRIVCRAMFSCFKDIIGRYPTQEELKLAAKKQIRWCERKGERL